MVIRLEFFNDIVVDYEILLDGKFKEFEVKLVQVNNCI
jgi:hypothetical protein